MDNQFMSLNKQNDSKIIKEMYEYAIEHNVPIISNDGFMLLKLIINLCKSKKILEIGTAIGYSAINMAMLSPDIHIDTIERNADMYQIATENIKKYGFSNRINVIFKDALDVEDNELNNDYDLIFIDAAKAQYTKFFEKYSKHLSEKGVIVSDNLLFHGLVNEKNIELSKNLRALVRKIGNYNEWLSKNKAFSTTFIDIGDGMAVSVKSES